MCELRVGEFASRRVASLRVCELKVCESRHLKERITCERRKRHIFIMGKILACSKFRSGDNKGTDMCTFLFAYVIS